MADMSFLTSLFLFLSPLSPKKKMMSHFILIHFFHSIIANPVLNKTN